MQNLTAWFAHRYRRLGQGGSSGTLSGSEEDSLNHGYSIRLREGGAHSSRVAGGSRGHGRQGSRSNVRDALVSRLGTSGALSLICSYQSLCHQAAFGLPSRSGHLSRRSQSSPLARCDQLAGHCELLRRAWDWCFQRADARREPHLSCLRGRRTLTLLSTEQLFIDWEAPLALGPKAFAYLLKTFEETHHSIDATVSALQVSCLHRTLRQRTS